MSVFVKYDDESSVLNAILALNKSRFNNCKLRASFGRTRFCFKFINN